jgi:hypothetical protein
MNQIVHRNYPSSARAFPWENAEELMRQARLRAVTEPLPRDPTSGRFLPAPAPKSDPRGISRRQVVNDWHITVEGVHGGGAIVERQP